MSSLTSFLITLQIASVLWGLTFSYGQVLARLWPALLQHPARPHQKGILGLAFAGAAALGLSLATVQDAGWVSSSSLVMLALGAVLGGWWASGPLIALLVAYTLVNDPANWLNLLFSLPVLTGAVVAHHRRQLVGASLNIKSLTALGLATALTVLGQGLYLWPGSDLTGLLMSAGLYVGLMVASGLTFGAAFKRPACLPADAHPQAMGHLLEETIDLVLKIDPQGNIQAASRAAARLLGYPQQALLGKNLTDFMEKGSDNALTWPLATPATSDPVTFTQILRDQKGASLYLNLTFYPLPGGDFQVTGRNITERVAAEQALARQREFEEILTQLSTRFINLPTDRIDTEIEKTLATISHFVEDIDRSYVFMLNADGQTTSNTHEWCAPGVPSVQAKLQHVPVTEEQAHIAALLRGDVFKANSVEALSDTEHAQLKERLRKNPVKSLLLVPMVYEGQTFGMVGYETLYKRVNWQENDINLLRMSGEIIANAVKRKAQQEQLERRNRYLVSLHETSLAILRRQGIEELLDNMTRQVALITGTEDVACYILDDSGRFMQQMVGQGQFAPYNEHILYPGDNLVWQAWERGDIIKSDDPASYPPTEAVACHCMVSIPLRLRQRVVGAFVLCETQAHQFTSEILTILEYLSELVSIALDNTRLHQAARHEITQREQIEQTLRRRNTALKLLHEFSLNATRLLPGYKGFDWLTSIVKLLFPNSNMTTIQLYEPDSETLRTHFDPDTERATQRKPLIFKRGYGIAGHALAEKRVICVPDVLEDPRYVRIGEDSTYRSLLVAPMITGTKLWGTLSIGDPGVAAFDPQDVQIAEMLGRQAAVILENIYLYKAEYKQRLYAEVLRDIANLLATPDNFTQVAQTTLAHIRRAIPFQSGNIMLVQDDGQLRFIADLGYQERGTDIHQLDLKLSQLAGIQHVMRTRKPLIVPDVNDWPDWHIAFSDSWIRSLIIVPIIVDGKIRAFINIEGDTTEYFSEEHQIQLVGFANQIATLLARQYLFEAERYQRQLAEALRDAVGMLNSTLALDELLGRILDVIETVIPHDGATIMLLSGSDMVYFAGCAGKVKENYPDLAQLPALPVNRLASIQQMMETNQPLLISDVEDHPLWRTVFSTDWVKSYAGAPIHNNDEIIGFLNIDSTEENFFDEKILEPLQTFADQAGIAIQKTRLLEAEQRQRQIADTLQEIALLITGSLQREKILPTILEQAARVIEYDAAAIWVPDDTGHWQVEVCTGYEQFGAKAALRSLQLTNANSQTLDEMQDTLKPVIRSHYETNNADFEWIGSLATAPIILRGEIVAKLALDHTQPGFYTDEHIPVLEALAAQVSIAIENATLFERTQAYAEQLEARVKERTLELEGERRQLQTILEGMGDGVIFTEYDDPQALPFGRIRYVNQTMADMVGVKTTDLIGETSAALIDVFIPQDTLDHFEREFAQFLERAFNSTKREVWSPQMILKPRRGKDIEVEITHSIIYMPDKDTHYGVAIVRNISQEKALQRQRQRFLANASHELRTPLTNLGTRLYLLRHQPDRQTEHINVIERTITGMTRLVNDLLDFLRIEEGAFVPEVEDFNLSALLQTIYTVQAVEAELKDIHFALRLPDTPIMMTGNVKHIELIVTNLVTNAINYTQQSGDIWLEASIQGGERVLIEVGDNGPGIAPENQIVIFEPFFRIEEHNVTGTGLGLAITRETVELYGGHIWVESTPGEGSTFYVDLPLVFHIGDTSRPRIFIP